MLSARVACLCLVLAVCAYGVASLEWEMRELSSFTIPVVMWSDKQIFSSPKTQVLDTLTTRDVEFALSSLFRTHSSEESILATSFNENREATEVVVLFVEPELTTDQVSHTASSGSFSHLKGALEAAGSSLVMPYATVEEVSLFDETLSNAFESIKQGSIFISRMPGSKLFTRLSRQSGVQTVDIDSLMAELKSANAFTNGVTDLVVVCFDKATFTSHDEIIGTISDSVRIATKGNYVAVYSANMPSTSRLIWTFEQHSEAEYFHNLRAVFDVSNLGNATNNTNGTHVVNYFPGPLIEVYLIVSILIAMVFTGGCAIFSLQTPDRWEAPKVKRETF